MLRKVRSFPYEMPLSLSSPLALLITEVIIYCISAKQRASWTVRSSSAHFPVQLLCKTPSRRLRTLDRFQRQTFFRGSTFDLDLLQRQPMEVTDETSECLVLGLVVSSVSWSMSLDFSSLLLSGDSGAAGETGPSGQSSTRPHFVPTASQRLRLRLTPQPTRHATLAAGSQRKHSHSCTAAWPSTPTASCSGKRSTQRSVCLTDTEFTV